jgi:hypothetical protein
VFEGFKHDNGIIRLKGKRATSSLSNHNTLWERLHRRRIVRRGVSVAQLEYGDYYKFIASAGIALIAGAVVVPWMFLREPFDLAIEASKIPLLTQDSQSIIHARQHLITAIVYALPKVSVGLATAGTLLTGIGLIGWHSRQSVRDKSEDLEAKKLEEELKAMSPAQIEERAKNEVENVEQAADEPEPKPSALHASSSLVASALAVEQAIQKKLRYAFGPFGTVMGNQRLGSVEFDAIIRMKSTSPIIIEMKYIRKGFNRGWLINTISNLTLRMAIYTKTFNENVSGLILIVIATTGSPLARRVIEFENELQKTHPSLLSNVRVRTIYESQIPTISDDEFRHLVLGDMN